MKLTNILIVTTIYVTGLFGGANVFADELRTVNTEGEITFVPNEDEELVVIPPVTLPEVEIPPLVPGTTGPLSILHAPTINFGEQKISSKNQTYNMIAEKQKLVISEERVPYISFAQVHDNRGNNEGWSLTITPSEFTSQTQNGVLRGAQISLLNPWMKYEGNEQSLMPSIHAEQLVLVPGASSVVMNALTGKGAGVSSINWGDQNLLNASEENVVRNSSIQLFVPGSSAKDATKYSATLSWELTTGVNNSI